MKDSHAKEEGPLDPNYWLPNCQQIQLQLTSKNEDIVAGRTITASTD